jgi:hypothetical protein
VQTVTPAIVVKAVAFGLVGTLILCVVGIIILAVLQQPIPDVLQNVTIGTLGAVAGLLARTGSDPQQVEVVNEPEDPVPTAEA